MSYSHPQPIFLDYETQSAADIREIGGRLYASHPSTRVLMLVFTGGSLSPGIHLWVPRDIDSRMVSGVYSPGGQSGPNALWPHQLQPAQTVTVHRDEHSPECLIAEIKQGVPLVAHNAFGFDRFIWDRFNRERAYWLDSMPLARSAGRPGGLDALSKSTLGLSKDHAKKLLPKLTVATRYPHSSRQEYHYPTIQTGDFLAFTRYAITDVVLLRRIWESTFDHLQVEEDVIAWHDAINQRGVRIDKQLLESLTYLSAYSVAHAIEEVTELTNGEIHEGNIRSVTQMHAWLNKHGVQLVMERKGKLEPCLRKELVQRLIDSPYVIEEHLSAAREIDPLVIQVLELRLKALRITDAKLTRARERLSPDGRLRDMHSYHQAHTGRFSSSGVQVHNLPRPIAELPLEQLVFSTHWGERDTAILFAEIKQAIPNRTNAGRSITVDDVCSAMIRPLFIPTEGYLFAICDLSQIEARLAAMMAGEQKMVQAFAGGRDLYREFACDLFNVHLDDVSTLQRYVAKQAILGCQYSIGPDKLRVYCAGAGVDLVKAGITAEQVVLKYRDTYTKIAGFRPDKKQNFRTDGIWHKLDKGTKNLVETGEPCIAAMCDWWIQAGDMLCRLPSGRIIYYPEVRIEDVIPPYVYTMGLPHVPKATVVYTSTRGPKSLYGGLLFENVVQAVARDIMVYGGLLISANGLDVCMHVHDEIVTEVPLSTSKNDLRRVVECMSTVPSWMPGLPLECEGFLSPRFVKKPFEGMYTLSTRELL